MPPIVKANPAPVSESTPNSSPQLVNLVPEAPEPKGPSSFYGFFSLHRDRFFRGGEGDLTGIEVGFGYKNLGMQAFFREQGGGGDQVFPFRNFFGITPMINVMNTYRYGAGGIPNLRLVQVGAPLGIGQTDEKNYYLAGLTVRGLLGYAGIAGLGLSLSFLTTPFREDKEWKVLLGLSLSFGVFKPTY